jgi:protein-S-isoprenylcysteine O-methyltransferase Ste14
MKRVTTSVPQLRVELAEGSASFDLNLVAGPRHATRRTPHLDLAELFARATIVTLFSLMAVRIGADFLETGRITGLLLLASETLVVLLTLFRRPTTVVDRSVRARVLTALSMMGPPLVRPSAAAAATPEFVTVACSALGLLVVIAGKVSLGRSFGLMPANRGVVSGGLYRMVRHPIYLGYLVTHVGFLIANCTAWNALMLAVADAALLVRSVCEEQTLARDAAYRAYQIRVRWRVLPGVF